MAVFFDGSVELLDGEDAYQQKQHLHFQKS
jgi:hypothetical protein